jgi:hypothetical protein
MKKVVVLALALTVTPFAIEAQNTAQVNATATILANVVATPLTNLEFGQLQPGTGTTVSTGAAAPGGQTLGEFQIVHNSNVTVSTTVPANLVGPGGNIAVTFLCAYASASQGPTDIGDVACDALPTRVVLLPGVDETSFVQVAGSISGADTNVQAGAYSTSMTFTVTAVN